MSTREGEMTAQLRHEPHVDHEAEGYWYCPTDWQGSVTRPAPGKDTIHGDAWEARQAQLAAGAERVAKNVTRIR